MEEKKTSVFSNGLIWFGAAVSIAEILTGTYLAPLGFGQGMAAMILGHIIGCVLLYLAGFIGGETGKSAMETVKLSFGEKGSLLFSALNVLQLVGWTAIMIVSGARAAATIMGGQNLWCVVIGGLILVWILIGVKNISKLNTVAMSALFILTVVLSFIIFRGGVPAGSSEGGMTFGAAVEMGVAMPLSWLPVISDYTRYAEKPRQATLVSTVVYFFASCWMYAIGLGAAVFTGESDIAAILLQAGLGVIGILIIVLSTVSTTFLDAFSAGVSACSISKKWSEKVVAIAACLIGMALAIFTPIENMENFLYLIGSVFAPMIAVQIADYFILKRSKNFGTFDGINLGIWLIGFILYRISMTIDTPVGNTLPVMAVTIVLCLIGNGLRKKNS
jgi:putative hydroxymethylpyrimidine transporter CytX